MQVSTPTTLSAAHYIQSRGRDYIALTHELSDSTTTIDGVKDLGYCKLDLNVMSVTTRTETQYFRGITEASAFILRRFW